MDRPTQKIPMGDKDDEHRQNIQENEKENDSKPNGGEQSLDDFRKDEEEEMTSFEKELLSTHNERRRMNRSTVQKQSTLVGETIDLEDSENDKEDIGEEKSQADAEEMEEGWRNALQQSVLATILLEEERDIAWEYKHKKRKGDSIERINDDKRERLEETAIDAISRIKMEIYTYVEVDGWWLPDIRNALNIKSWKLIVRILGDLRIFPYLQKGPCDTLYGKVAPVNSM
uniref:Uncharacterized protein DDB_G0283697-like n=1 Tax=Diabrotica virgifera virgifera TaxID=50390 RepID=A0A6P7GE87_DIAVI